MSRAPQGLTQGVSRKENGREIGGLGTGRGYSLFVQVIYTDFVAYWAGNSPAGAGGEGRSSREIEVQGINPEIALNARGG